MPDGKEIVERMKQFEAGRGNWNPLWQECGDYGMPGNNQITIKSSPGGKRIDTFQTVAENCILQLAGGLYSYMFPTDSKAFVLRIDDEELAENEEVKIWLDRVTTKIHEYLIQSNFRQAFFEFLKSLACFGTACFYSEQGKKKPLNFVNFHIARVYIAVNSDGIIDTVYRDYEYTARQAVQEFGEENLGEVILTAYRDAKTKDKKFRFIHAVEPRDGVINNNDPLTMSFASIYVSREDEKVVSESGHPEMPYQIDRFDKDALEDLGRSPMMTELPNVKMLGQANKVYIKANEKMCDPPIVLPDDGSIWPLATQPGGVIHKRAGGEDPTWFEFKGNLQGLLEFINTTTANIRSGFHLDLFDALIDRQNMTATEVMARIEQKMRMLVHIIGGLQSEFFNPLIERVIGILLRAKPPKLPKMPTIMSEKEVRIEYLGRLALALKTLESEGFVKTTTDMATLGDAGIAALMENLDLDIISRDMSRNAGMPSTWLKDIKVRDDQRDAQAEQAQAAALAETVPDLVKAAKNLSGKPEEGSIIKEVMNAA